MVLKPPQGSAGESPSLSLSAEGFSSGLSPPTLPPPLRRSSEKERRRKRKSESEALARLPGVASRVFGRRLFIAGSDESRPITACQTCVREGERRWFPLMKRGRG